MSNVFTCAVRGIPLAFETGAGLFSPAGVDRGTRAMLDVAALSPGMKVLDMGCGWGLVGIYAAKVCGEQNVWMADIDPRAVAAAEKNAARNGVSGVHIVQSDAFSAIDEAGFDVILINPPYQSDFSVPKRMIEKGFNRLRIGGRMLMVTKRETWYRNKLSGVFGGVRVHAIDGYFVFESVRLRAARGRPNGDNHIFA
jgi:16S rRNA (guanine1207-N2)-methyltransferase